MNTGNVSSLIKVLQASTVAFSALGGCTLSEANQCSSMVAPMDLEKANGLIIAFEDTTSGSNRGQAVFATYEVIVSKKCESVISLEMSPRRAKPGDTEAYSGSNLRYTVDLETGEVEKFYVE